MIEVDIETWVAQAPQGRQYGERRWPEWRMHEVFRLHDFRDPIGTAPIDRFPIIWTGGLTLIGP